MKFIARITAALTLSLALATVALADQYNGPVLYMNPIVPGTVYYPFMQNNAYGWYYPYGAPYGGPYGTFYGSGAYGMAAYQPFGFSNVNIFYNPIQYSINQIPYGHQVSSFLPGGNAFSASNGMPAWTGSTNSPFLNYSTPGAPPWGLASPYNWGVSGQIIDPIHFTRPACNGSTLFRAFGTPFVICNGVPMPAMFNSPIPSMIYFQNMQKQQAAQPPAVPPVVQGNALPTGAVVNSGAAKPATP